MEVYRTIDGQVTKYIHDDGSETAIKFVGSCDNQVGLSKQARNKYSMFLSVSSGCMMKCKFCYLTVKKCGFSPLTKQQIVANAKEAITEATEANPSIKNRYIKLSWMGMGDALAASKMVLEATMEILDYILDNGYAKGLDGVDLSTVYPNLKIDFTNYTELNLRLTKYKINPEHTDGRSPFRLFYSLHHPCSEQRATLIPGTVELLPAITTLNDLSYYTDIDIIYHYILLKDFNDSYKDLEMLIELLNTEACSKHELRVLRFNECPNSPFKEAPDFDGIVKLLSKSVNKLKYQVSTGSEVKAACGQFLLKHLKGI